MLLFWEDPNQNECHNFSKYLRKFLQAIFTFNQPMQHAQHFLFNFIEKMKNKIAIIFTCQTSFFIARRCRHYGKLSKIFEKERFFEAPKQHNKSWRIEVWRNKQYTRQQQSQSQLCLLSLSRENRHFILISTRAFDRQPFCCKRLCLSLVLQFFQWFIFLNFILCKKAV